MTISPQLLCTDSPLSPLPVAAYPALAVALTDEETEEELWMAVGVEPGFELNSQHHTTHL